jgi:hypothetical protein
MKSLAAAIGKASGKTVWVKAGTYAINETVKLAGSNVRISGITSGAMPVLDFSGSTQPSGAGNNGAKGITVSGSKYHLRYLELKKAGDNCIYVTGADNQFEWLDMHECADTGLQISSGGAGNKVINCDSHLHKDPIEGENGDGFAAKINIGAGNEFMGCRSWQNVDDGWDFYDAGKEPVNLTYCWAFNMKHPAATSASDGNGIKLGGERQYGTNGPHKLSECFSFHNPSWGFDLNNNNSGGVTCTGCGAWGNGKGAFEAGIKTSGNVTLSVSASAAASAKRDANGNLPDIAKL